MIHTYTGCGVIGENLNKNASSIQTKKDKQILGSFLECPDIFASYKGSGSLSSGGLVGWG